MSGLPSFDPGDAHAGDGARRRGDVRRQRDVREVAEAAEVDRERRARVEAEPAEPEDERAENGIRDVVAGDRVRPPVRPELADPRAEDQRAGEAGERSLVVHDRRAGEVLHALREEPAVRAPDPVRDDRVRDREPDAEREVDPQLRPLGHRAPDDRERDAREHDLEQVARRPRDLREPFERLLPDRRSARRPTGRTRRSRPGRSRRRTRGRSRRPSRRASRGAKIRTFLPAMWPAFFIRVRPASRNAKPACMNITRMAVTTTQIVDRRDEQIVVLRHRLSPPPGSYRSGCG